MSLITRCPACGTMFKVVTDQLKVSQGWVRCGRCADVFDASRHLQPQDTSSSAFAATAAAELGPAEDDVPGVLAEPASAMPEPTADAVPISADAVKLPAEPDWSFPRWVAGKLTHAAAAPAPDSDVQDSVSDFDPAGWKEALQKRQQREDGAASDFSRLGYGKKPTSPASDFSGLADEAPAGDEPPRRPDLVRKATVADAEFEEEFDASMAHDLDAEKEVSFVRDAERKAFWKRPVVRGVLVVCALVLALGLLLQWVLQQKDSLAVLEPRLEPVLQLLCGQIGCQIRPPRRVESLVIDSSTFNKIAADGYRLSFVLKNTSSLAVEMPALELTLTDSQDQAVVRRVVLPAQFGAGSRLLAARSEVAGVVSLRVTGEAGRPASSTSSSPSAASGAPLRVAGYRVLAFYP